MKHRMLRLSLAVSACVAFNAVAQDHSQHVSPLPREPEAQAQHPPGHTQTPPVATKNDTDHASMGHEPPPSMEEHDHESMQHGVPADSRTDMDHGSRDATNPLTPIPLVTDADRAAAVKPPGDHAVHDNTVQSFVLFNRLEAVDTDDGTVLQWEGQGWVGTDLNKLWFRTEGERDGDGQTEAADLEVMYGRAIAPWWDVVAGVRHDFKPGDSQDFAAIGIVGMAPYKFEVEATAYIGESGQTAARVEAEYETLLTNRLILQPLVELNFHGKDDAERGIGSGLSTAEVGLRMRYEITRRFAPYIGLVAERAFGRTADFRRDHGENVDDARVVAGVRIWF